MQIRFNIIWKTLNSGCILLGVVGVLFWSFGDSVMSQEQRLCIAQEMFTKGSSLYVKVAVENRTGTSVFIENIPEFRERTLGQDFEITSNGASIQFIGATAKRKPYERDDFFELKPGGGRLFEVRLDLDYKFMPGKHRYKISYALMTYDVVEGQVEAVYSAPVEFEYTNLSL